MAWNSKNGEFAQTKTDLVRILQIHKPHILAVSEINISKNIDLRETNVYGYTLELDKQYEKNGYARSGMYINNNIIYKRVKNFEPENSATVCVKVGFPGQRKQTVYAHYRQWSRRFAKISKNIELKDQQQLFKFNEFIKGVNKNKKINDEVIVLGDFNFDGALASGKIPITDYQKRMSKFAEVVSENLLQNGFQQLIKTPTRGENILDQIFINKPGKINNYGANDDGASDHMLIWMERMKKIERSEQTMIKGRNLSNVDGQQVNYLIQNHPSFNKTIKAKNPNFIATNIIKIINQIFDNIAPIKITKLKSAKQCFISKSTQNYWIKKS